MQVDVFILYVGNQKKYDASSASGYITGMHFSNTVLMWAEVVWNVIMWVGML